MRALSFVSRTYLYLAAHKGHMARLDAISSGVPPEVLIAAAEEWRLQRAAFPELASDDPSRRAEVAAGDEHRRCRATGLAPHDLPHLLIGLTDGRVA